jgi:hypothetical protein
MNIDKIIRRSNLNELCNVKSGDCESVAVALSRVFEVDSFVCVYEPSEKRKASHATVRINGNLYDGSGRLSYDKEALIDYLGLWKVRDVDSVDNREDLYDFFKEECLFEIQPDKSNLNYDEKLVNSLVERLESEK